ncbi:BrnA antitoxin family protein [Halomonas sp. IOP_31]|uniref:BrnA antitoxin family protein n=1 Tax=Halomonas sp. IOP_31 TaxID=2876584 RepID=UPI002F3FA706|nr:BrnA antitoxin family protein [Halomonas sp. IOP_31]
MDDEAPEWTDDDFRRARPACEALPEIFGEQAAEEMLTPRRGRPVAERRKAQVSLRLDPDVIEAFRDTGPGWQTRMNQALKVFLREHSANELDR